MKKEWRPTRVTGIRKIDRAVAKENMKRKGYKRFCKHSYSSGIGLPGKQGQTIRIDSNFSQQWRDFIYR